MAMHNVNPVREQIRSEIIAALANGAAMSAAELYTHCPSATESTEIARIAHDMRRTGKLDTGEQVIHPLGMKVNTYCLPTTTDPRIEASKPIVIERKIPRTGKAPKPAASNPYARFSIGKPQEAPARVTRDLPMHLQSTAPQMDADELGGIISPNSPTTHQDHIMSEDPLHYVPDPDAFSLEPKEPEAEEDIDSDLVDALLELAHMEPKDQGVDDVLAMASADVGEIAAAMGKAPKKVCKCVRINSLPPLPTGYQYSSITADVVSDDGGLIKIRTMDDGEGPFCEVEMFARMRFDVGDIAKIGQVADALIKLHESMDKQNID